MSLATVVNKLHIAVAND